MALQYDLYNQIECKISPVNIKEIRDKAAIGQWEDTSCGYGWFTYIKSGIKTLLQGAYIKERLKLSEEQIEGFRMVAFQEIGKSVDSSKEKHYTCIEKFKEAYPAIVNKLMDFQIWRLFP